MAPPLPQLQPPPSVVCLTLILPWPVSRLHRGATEHIGIQLLLLFLLLPLLVFLVTVHDTPEETHLSRQIILCNFESQRDNYSEQDKKEEVRHSKFPYLQFRLPSLKTFLVKSPYFYNRVLIVTLSKEGRMKDICCSLMMLLRFNEPTLSQHKGDHIHLGQNEWFPEEKLNTNEACPLNFDRCGQGVYSETSAIICYCSCSQHGYFFICCFWGFWVFFQ